MNAEHNIDKEIAQLDQKKALGENTSIDNIKYNNLQEKKSSYKVKSNIALETAKSINDINNSIEVEQPIIAHLRHRANDTQINERQLTDGQKKLNYYNQSTMKDFNSLSDHGKIGNISARQSYLNETILPEIQKNIKEDG